MRRNFLVKASLLGLFAVLTTGGLIFFVRNTNARSAVLIQDTAPQTRTPVMETSDPRDVMRIRLDELPADDDIQSAMSLGSLTVDFAANRVKVTAKADLRSSVDDSNYLWSIHVFRIENRKEPIFEHYYSKRLFSLNGELATTASFAESLDLHPGEYLVRVKLTDVDKHTTPATFIETAIQSRPMVSRSVRVTISG